MRAWIVLLATSSLLISVRKSAWTAEQVYENVFKRSTRANIFDPNNFLSRDEQQSIQDVIDDISKSWVRLYVLNSLDSRYIDYYSKQPNTEMFLSELIYRINPTLSDIFILFVYDQNLLVVRPMRRALDQWDNFCTDACLNFSPPVVPGLIGIVKELKKNSNTGLSGWQRLAIALGVIFGVLILLLILGPALFLRFGLGPRTQLQTRMEN